MPPAAPLLDARGTRERSTPTTILLETPRAAQLLRPAAFAALLVCLAGVLSHFFVVHVGAAQPLGANIFFVLYCRYELPFIALTALFALAALAARGDGTQRPLAPIAAPAPVTVLLLALGVLVASWIATHLLFQQFALSMDEYSAHFQASIYASGRLTAPVPEQFRGAADGITPIYSTYLPQTGAWTTMYLPVYAAMRAAFLLVGVEWLVNPALAAASVLLLGAVARRIWPDDGRRQWIALLMLVTSAQFLVTAGSAYSMPAHLCLNLLWLLLWLRDDRISLAALPFVGVLALGLHNPFPHALFVLPFLLRLVVRRRWHMVAWTGTVYAAGSLYWLRWLEGVQPQARQGGVGGLMGLFHLPVPSSFVIHAMNLTLLATWQTPVVSLGLAAALWRFRSLEHPLRELAYGAALTFGFYFLFPSAQGHGWGYRYLFPVLGGIVLLAADGWPRLADQLRPRAARLLLAGGLALGLVQLPARAVEVAATVRPFAAASAYLHSLPADMVVLSTDSYWYGQDLVRNEPSLDAGPVILAASNVTAEQYQALRGRLGAGARVHIVTFAELARFGLQRPFPVTPSPAQP